jgi:hypothetical protein
VSCSVSRDVFGIELYELVQGSGGVIIDSKPA